MKRTKLNPQEKGIEGALLKNEYANAGKAAFLNIADAIAARKKDAVLNIRINRQDLDSLKKKANKLGVKYQTFIAEILHRIAQG